MMWLSFQGVKRPQMNALEVFLGAAAKVQEKGNKKIEYT
jgi:hypothetical protein